MPLKSRLWELLTWHRGGPDGDDAFSSLTPLQRVHREKKIRATEHMQLLRDIKGRNKELGRSLQQLLRDRERLSKVESKIFKGRLRQAKHEPKEVKEEEACEDSPKEEEKSRSEGRRASEGRFRRPSVVIAAEPLRGMSLPRRSSVSNDGLSELWSTLQAAADEGEEEEEEVEQSDEGFWEPLLEMEEEDEVVEEAVEQPRASDSLLSLDAPPSPSRSRRSMERQATPARQAPMSRQVTPLGRQSTPAISSSSNLEWKEDKAEAPKKSEVRAPRKTVAMAAVHFGDQASRPIGRRSMFVTASTKAKKSGSQPLVESKPEPVKKRRPSLPFRVISWSSQRCTVRSAARNLEKDRSLGDGLFQWETDGKPDHSIFLDFGHEMEFSSLKLRCTGTRYDPKNITVMRAVAGVAEIVDEQPQSSNKERRGAAAVSTGVLTSRGTWAVVQRGTLRSGPSGRDRHRHAMQLGGIQARFLQLIFHESWSPSGNIRILQPLSFYGQKLLEVQRKTSLCVMFSERMLLDDAEMETRKLARTFDIPLDHTHTVRKEFMRFDTERRGYLTFNDFMAVVKALTARPFCRADSDLQDTHLRALWGIVDKDGSGCVDFEEFLQWFHGHFLKEKPPARSLHNVGKNVESVTEHFYASMGVNRLRGYLTTFGEGAPGISEDEYAANEEELQRRLARKKAVWLRASLVAATGKGKLERVA